MSSAETTTYREAINSALRDSMRQDASVVVLGEDIAAAGGPFKVTDGLLAEFGADRVTDTPISETALIGAGIGLALAGFRPVIEMMFAEFAACAWDQILNQAAKYRYMSAGQMNVPMVVRCVGGGGLRFGAQHSQTTESWYLSAPGLKVVVPATPQDAYSQLVSAIRDPDPVIYIEHKKLYSLKGSLDPQLDGVDFQSASVVLNGSDVTLVASLAMVHVCLEAARLLANDGIHPEIIDLRSLSPLDTATIQSSVERTGRLLTVEEQTVAGGWGNQVIAVVAERSLESLLHPPVRLGLPNAPLPFSPVLEDAAIPSASSVAGVVREMLSR